MEAQKLSLTIKGEKFKDVKLNGAVILQVTYSNGRFALDLQQKGVPLVADETPEESHRKAQVKTTQFALRAGGGNAVKSIYMKDKDLVTEGTGKQISTNWDDCSINGFELFDTMAQLVNNTGNTVYARTRKKFDQNGRLKYTTKAYLIAEDKVDEKMKKGNGSKKFSLPEAREALRELINATWNIHVYENPTSTVFHLVSRQPEKVSTLNSSPFSLLFSTFY